MEVSGRHRQMTNPVFEREGKTRFTGRIMPVYPLTAGVSNNLLAGLALPCTNLYEDSPAFKYADAGLVANVLDKERNLEIAKEYKPDAVLTEQSDIAVPTVAYVAEKLGLKGIGIEVADRFTNKYKMREFASKAGVPVPEYKLCRTVDEAAIFLNENPLKIGRASGRERV